MITDIILYIGRVLIKKTARNIIINEDKIATKTICFLFKYNKILNNLYPKLFKYIKNSSIVIEQPQYGLHLVYNKTLNIANKKERDMLSQYGIFNNYVALKINQYQESEIEKTLALVIEMGNNLDYKNMSFEQITEATQDYLIARKYNQKLLIENKDYEIADPEIVVPLHMDFITAKCKLLKLKSLDSYICEGYKQKNCIGADYVPNDKEEIFSLRDKDNNPIYSILVSKKERIVLQAQGKNQAEIFRYTLVKIAEKMNWKLKESKEAQHYFVKNYIKKSIALASLPILIVSLTELSFILAPIDYFNIIYYIFTIAMLCSIFFFMIFAVVAPQLNFNSLGSRKHIYHIAISAFMFLIILISFNIPNKHLNEYYDYKFNSRTKQVKILKK